MTNEVLIFGARAVPPRASAVAKTLTGWRVTDERGAFLRVTGLRLALGNVSLRVRPLPQAAAATAISSTLTYVTDHCLAEDILIPQRFRGVQQVLRVEGVGDQASQAESLRVIRAVAEGVLGMVAINGRLEDSAGRVLARPWPSDLARPVIHPEPAAVLTAEEQEVRDRGQARRDRSSMALSALGAAKPPEHLPFMDEERPRPQASVVNRALALHIVINVGYGMPVTSAREWLKREGLGAELTDTEAAFIGNPRRDADAVNAVKTQVEALWCLAWALGQVPNLDFGSYCGDSLASLLPDLRRDEGSARFAQASRMRSTNDLLDALDLAYCLSWGAAESNLSGTPRAGHVRQYVVWERRRALEWIHGDDWDQPDLST